LAGLTASEGRFLLGAERPLEVGHNIQIEESSQIEFFMTRGSGRGLPDNFLVLL